MKFSEHNDSVFSLVDLEKFWFLPSTICLYIYLSTNAHDTYIFNCTNNFNSNVYPASTFLHS
jgi:hypothetical protein